MSKIFKPKTIKIMGRPPIGLSAMTNAERANKSRAKKKLLKQQMEKTNVHSNQGNEAE